jgi:hypothetical protein
MEDFIVHSGEDPTPYNPAQQGKLCYHAKQDFHFNKDEDCDITFARSQTDCILNFGFVGLYLVMQHDINEQGVICKSRCRWNLRACVRWIGSCIEVYSLSASIYMILLVSVLLKPNSCCYFLVVTSTYVLLIRASVCTISQ